MPLLAWFRNLPIGKKIGRAIWWTNITVLILISSSLLIYELRTAPQKNLQYVSTLSDLVASNSAGAVAFGDQQAAMEILANLKNQDEIMGARLYKTDGQPFADYLRTGISEKVLPYVAPAIQADVHDGRIRVAQRVTFRDDNIGTLFMQSDMSRVYERWLNYLTIIAVIGVVLVPFIFILSAFLERIILKPVQDLDDVAHQITTEKMYSLRAAVPGTDEIGRLTHSFNLMIESVEAQDKKLLDQADELRRSNKDLEQFAYVSSHDLQEPLRKITTYSQLIEDKYKNKLDPEAAKFIDNICTSASRMRSLISNLLTYSRVTRQEIKGEMINLDALLRDVLDDMSSTLTEKNGSAVVDPLPEVPGNSTQLQQLFQNLIGNALKFHGTEAPRIHITAEKNGVNVKFAVKDNGIGLDPKYAEQIFQVFQRLHGRDEYPGTGIGLAICKKIVEQNGGEIWVESQVGRGATFFFTWPLTP